MSDEKIEAMFQVLHQENKAIMMTLIASYCILGNYEKTRDNLEKNWDEVFKKVMGMK